MSKKRLLLIIGISFAAFITILGVKTLVKDDGAADTLLTALLTLLLIADIVTLVIYAYKTDE